VAPESTNAPFAHRQKSAINLAIGLVLIASAIVATVVVGQATAAVPLLIAGLGSVRHATGERMSFRDLALALREFRGADRKLGT
jgi:hypothetical protein